MGFFTAHKRSFGQGNVFIPMCHSVRSGGGGGGFQACITGHMTKVVCIQRGLPQGGSASRGKSASRGCASREGVPPGGCASSGVCIQGVCLQRGVPPGRYA